MYNDWIGYTPNLFEHTNESKLSYYTIWSSDKQITQVSVYWVKKFSSTGQKWKWGCQCCIKNELPLAKHHANSTFNNCTVNIYSVHVCSYSQYIYLKRHLHTVTIIAVTVVHKFDAKLMCKPFCFLVAPKLEYLYYLSPILKIAKRVYLLQ